MAAASELYDTFRDIRQKIHMSLEPLDDFSDHVVPQDIKKLI